MGHVAALRTSGHQHVLPERGLLPGGACSGEAMRRGDARGALHLHQTHQNSQRMHGVKYPVHDTL